MSDLEFDEALAVLDGLTDTDRCCGCGERCVSFFCKQRTDHGTYSFCAGCVKSFQMRNAVKTPDVAARILRFCGFKRFFERNGHDFGVFLSKVESLNNIEHMMMNSKEFRGQWVN